MQFTVVILSALLGCSYAHGQSGRRLAIMGVNDSTTRSNPKAAAAENRLADDLTAKLAGQPGLTLIDRASLDRILKEQNQQFSDRSSADTAVRIGRLAGAGQIVLVHVIDASYSTHQEGSGGSTKTTGTVVLRANARMVDVETGVILAQPASTFEESVVVATTKKNQQVQLPIPGWKVIGGGGPATTTTGTDPKVAEDNEWAKASEAVTTELAAKLTGSAVTVPSGKVEFPMVAGIRNGSVYINQGTSAGFKAGDKFQVTRDVSLDMNDPKTGLPLKEKQRVCVLTLTSTSESLAFGPCQGGLPMAKDIAEPMK